MRDTRVEYHVYANPASHLLHQAGQASKRQLSRFGKGIRRSSQRLTQYGKCRRRPSLVVFLKLPVTRDSRVLESELLEPRLESGPESLAPCPALALTTDSIFCLPDDKLTRPRRENKSCEDLSQINSLPKLRVTNPDLPSTIALRDNDPYEGTNSASPQQPLDGLRNTSENPIHDASMQPLAKDPAGGGLAELDSDTRTAQEQELEWPRSWHDGSTYSRPDTYELWLPESVSRSPSSDPHLVCALLSRSHHESDSALPSRNLAPQQLFLQLAPGDHWTAETRKMTSTAAPSCCDDLRAHSPETFRLSQPPRIPSIYFRSDSPFADGNLPWE